MEPTTTTTPEIPPTQTKPTRPKHNDPAIVQAAIEKMKDRVWRWTQQDGPDAYITEANVLTDLTRACSHRNDGYDIAHDLDSRGWSPDAELVDILDNFGMYKSTAFVKAQEEWVKSNGITPPFIAGTKVKAQWGGNEIVGVVKVDEAGHYSPTGQFALDVEGRQGSPIVKWEDCQAA